MQTKIIEKLDNGLQLILCPDETKHTTYAELMTNFGGLVKDYKANGEEYHLIDGIAHLLEHTLIDTSLYGNVLQHFHESHVSFNGVTTRFTTSFYIDTVKHFYESLEKLINIVNVGVFTPETLEVTKRPIFDEIRKNQDRRFYNYNRTYTENVYDKTDFRDNLGTIEEIGNISYEEVKRCHDTFYHPSNQILMISGNFDVDKVKELVTNTYNKINKEKIDFEIIDVDVSSKLDKKEIYVKDEKEDEIVNITFKIDLSKFTPYEGLLLSHYFNYFMRYNFDDTSDLFNDLIDKKYTVFSIDTSIAKVFNYIFVDIGCFTKEKDYFINKVLEIINNKDVITEDKFTLMKKRGIVNQILKEESCHAILRSIIDNIIDHNYYDADKLSDINSLTIEEYKKFMDRLDFSDYFIITQGKED
jgi:predicted Zn-dependent peptidase